MPFLEDLFGYPLPESEVAGRRKVDVVPVTEKTASGHASKAMEEAGFRGKAGQTWCEYGKGGLEAVYVGVNDPLQIYDLAAGAQKAAQIIDKARIGGYAFRLAEKGLSARDQTTACAGWYLGCYAFDLYKSEKAGKPPALLWPSGADKARAEAIVESHYLLRNLINIPANRLGPEELAQAAACVAGRFGAQIFFTREPEIEREFPLVFAIGDSSPRRPVVIDMRWGNPSDPPVALVGKGVCFDTGGLDVKPHEAMMLMKKDMGGAAHALALAAFIMRTGLPVNLRVIVPAVENAISGKAFRHGDVFHSRKGITVENGNCDAEGRMVLADCLTLASEEKPELIIDFATLTGSTRAGLGFDIPAFFCTRDGTLDELRALSFDCNDPVWPLPLWAPYRKDINGDVADIANVGKARGDSIHAALFLKEFLNGDPEWIHLDIYAWEQTGKPGRPKGGAETGLRAILALLEKRYRR